MKRRSVVFAPEAAADLYSLYDWIANAAGPNTALAYVERLESFCLSLDLASERGQERSDVRPGLRVTGFEGRVTVAFHVTDENVTILRLFYGGQDWENRLQAPQPLTPP